MGSRDRIESLIKEAELYQSQGLLNESKERFREILETVAKDEDLSNDGELVELVRSKAGKVDVDIEEVEGESDVPELSEEEQNLISELFSFSENEDTAAVESAVALATFGQYEKALSEFQKLLDRAILPMDVAKNMLQCHLSLGRHEDAVSQLQEWIASGTFPGKELSRLCVFLEDTSAVESAGPEADEDTSEKDLPELLWVRLILDEGHLKGQTRDFGVRFQLGSSVSIDLEKSEAELLSYLEPGARISNVQCYTSYYLFNASGTVSENSEVIAGARKGDRSIVLSLRHP